MISWTANPDHPCNATVQDSCRVIRRAALENRDQAGTAIHAEAGISGIYLELGESISDLRILAPRGLLTLALAKQTMGYRQTAGCLAASLLIQLLGIHLHNNVQLYDSEWQHTTLLSQRVLCQTPVGVWSSCQACAFRGGRSW